MNNVNYIVGFDVGLYSVGCCALEVDESGRPVRILSALSHIHDSGLDPDKQKSSTTRLATSGLARRTRRLYRRRSKRMKTLESFLKQQNWLTRPFEDYDDPYYPWRVRASLATEMEKTPSILGEKLSVAIRHIAGHRGWRNPYVSVKSLYTVTPDSPAFLEIKKNIQNATGKPLNADVTVGQAICAIELGKIKVRGENNKILTARLFQSDLANEIWKISQVQGLPETLTKQIIDHVFHQRTPKGSFYERIGSDPLAPSHKRALKATDAFQRYRIVTVLSNLRIQESDYRPLTPDELQKSFSFLIQAKAAKRPTWNDLANLLGIPRNKLRGTAVVTEDGEVSRNQPPIHETEAILSSTTIKPLKAFWKEATREEKDELIQALSNSGTPDVNSRAGNVVSEFISGLSDDEIAKLDTLHLPFGRAAYSEATLEKLTDEILSTGETLPAARSKCFTVPSDWVPPKPAIGEPVGNPAVDKVLKIVNRYLHAAEKKWGQPQSVNIEHVRKGFVSVKVTKEIDKENKKRAEKNQATRIEMAEKLGLDGAIRDSAVRRFQVLQRQNCQCLYCGAPIDFKTLEMDHIVPRAGIGSTNKRENLVAVCPSCNRSKNNLPFARWAKNNPNPQITVKAAVERTDFWQCDPDMNKKSFKKFTKHVQDRLKRTDADEEIDARSIESVAWMANELRARIAQYFNDKNSDKKTKVRVFRGSITSEARKASGIERRIEYINGPGKSRLDRRHHAVDALVVALMSSFVAETLTIRRNLKDAQRATESEETWRDFKGVDASHIKQFNNWSNNMKVLVRLLQQALDQDEIPVTKNLRLRFGNGRVHEDTGQALIKLPLGSEISSQMVKRSATEAQWVALTRHPDFDPKDGLKENSEREIRIHGQILSSDDDVAFFPKDAAMMLVPQGAVELGNAIHHARVYKYAKGKKESFGILRVYTVDLLKHQHEDLFKAEIKPQSVSMRYGDPAVVRAIQAGEAQYLGWLVTDDELYIPNIEALATGQLKTLLDEYGPIRHWTVDGFPSPQKLRLRPRLLSKEGLSEESHSDIRKLLDSPGWRVSSNVVFGKGEVRVIRRTQLGWPRTQSASHLPITWEVK
ncbi:type II CRISPR RNA-guided endonuclease Cas9 [Corynebacterium glucuronolyticum]